MDILQLIDRLEELFNDAKAVPFTHNVIVDEDRMLELIDQMRIAKIGRASCRERV